jgi:hypothetical protein
MRSAIVVVAVLGVACTPQGAPHGPERARLRRTGGTTFELVPAEGQLERCLAYTVNAGGLTRQLTMSRRNESFGCPPNRPVGGHGFRVPLGEGPVKVVVLFTSTPVSAASVSQQLLEQANRQAFTAMDLRLPGAAALEFLDFAPEADVAPTEGQTVGHDAG